MTKQPEALRLADDLDRNCEMGWPDYDTQMGAAAELRCLLENQELLEALQRIKHHFDTDEYAWKIAEQPTYKWTDETEKVPDQVWVTPKLRPLAKLAHEQQIAEALRRHGLTLVKTSTGYDVLKLGQISAHGIKEDA